MAQLQQQLRLNESHLVLAPLSLLQFKLISSQKFSSTSKRVLHHFILISPFLVHPRSLWSTSYIQAPTPKSLYFSEMCGEQSDGETAWWSEIWQIIELIIEISVREVMWRKLENRDILTFDGPKHRAYTRPRRGFTGPHMDHLFLLEMKLSRNLKEIQEKWRWILREIWKKSRWLILRL